ncbi:MAG: ATP-binding cassette domain-containing protein [Candidatus Latescibacteria bacterium]|nr:ATP-binding cassette domain-containing protein [Candidatus Latescibacterota bacterium]
MADSSDPWADDISLRQRWAYLPRLLGLFWRLGRWQIVLWVAIITLHGTLPVGSVIVLRHLIDSALATATGTQPLALALSWLGLFLVLEYARVMVVMAGRNRWLSGNIEEKLKAGVQQRLLEKAARLRLEDFARSQHYDRLHRAQQSLDRQMITTFMHLFNLPAALLTVIGLVLYVGAAHPLFPLILLAGLLPGHLSRIAFRRRTYSLNLRHTRAQRMRTYLGELVSGPQHAAEIRLFGLHQHLLGKWDRACRHLHKETVELKAREFKQTTFSTATSQLTFGLVLTGVVALIARGGLSVGYYAAFLSAAERFRGALSQVLWACHSIDADLRYIRDLLEYLDLPEERRGGRSPAPKAAGHVPEIRFEGVEFRYPDMEQPVLAQIDLVIPPGQRLALVGHNGAGKTTLGKLLLGLYQPTAGRILVDGVDLVQLDLTWWRHQVSAVFQDYMRYQLTPRDNIGFGQLAHLHRQPALEQAAAKSGAAELIAGLAAGYETPLGRIFDAEGTDLSVGQWQRLGLARAYLRQAAVLVLDEPTAALDPRAEVDIYRRFSQLAQGKSVLFISHRLAAARLADRIVFLEGGRMVEEGSHDELLQRPGGRYGELFKTQAAWYES